MNRSTLLLVVCLLLLGTLVWGIVGTSTSVFEPGPEPGDIAAAKGESGRDQLQGEPGTESDDRNESDSKSGDGAPRQAVDAATIEVTGRCIAAETRAPLAGCLVSLRSGRGGLRGPGRPRNTTADPVSVYTDHEGRFAIEMTVHKRQALVLTTRLSGRADVRGNLGQSDGDIDTGDIEIPTGARLQGRVVDEEGVPVPGVGLRFFHATTGTPPRFAPIRWINATSDEQGSLVPEEYLVHGAWNVNSNGLVRLLKPVGPLQIEEGHLVAHVTFVVKPPDPKGLITGKVLDEKGEPVARVSVHAKGDAKWPVGYGYTDQNGRFQVRCRQQPGDPVQLTIPAARGFERLLTSESYPWGSENVILTLQRAGDIEVTVVEAGTGRPVEDYRIVWFQVVKENFVARAGKRGRVGHYAEGRATIAAVPTGTIGIVIVPVDGGLAPNDPIEVVKGSGRPEVRIELERRVDLPVRVVMQDGRRVPGTQLELLQARDDRPITLNTFGRDHSFYMQLARQKTTPLLLDKAKTNATGDAILRWRVSDRTLAIRVLGPGHVPVVRQGILVKPSNEPIEIVVNAGASISGVVKPVSVLRELGLNKNDRAPRGQVPTMIFTYSGKDGPRGAQRRKTTQIDGGGNFALSGLHPGTWSVVFRVWRFSRGRGSSVGTKEFPPVTLGEGDDRRLEYDIQDMLPATLRGQVFLNGRHLVKRRVYLTPLPKPGSQGRPRPRGATIITTDDGGAFVVNDLYPGRYRLSVEGQRRGAGRRPRLSCPATVEVPPGGQTSEIFHIQSGVLQLRITEKGGKPLVGGVLDIHDEGSGFRTSGRTDGEGRLVLDPIAVGRYTVGFYPQAKARPGGPGLAPRKPVQNRSIRLGEVRVGPGSTPSAFEFSLPAK